MTSYNFDAPDTDTILRSSDGKELHVHRLILSLASPVFQGMFNLPQPTEPPFQIPTIDIPESSDILQPFIQFLYPRSPPPISDLPMWEALYTIADKYIAEVVMGLLRDVLTFRFLEKTLLCVYALASRWGFVQVAKVASLRTLKFDILKDLSREDAEVMGGAACQQLYLLHFKRREAIQDMVTNHPSTEYCGCDPPDYSVLIPNFRQVVQNTHWLTIEALYKAGRSYYPKACSDKCHNEFQNVHSHFTSILKEISKLPRTI